MVATPSLMIAGPDAWHLRDPSSLSVFHCHCHPANGSMDVAVENHRFQPRGRIHAVVTNGPGRKRSHSDECRRNSSSWEACSRPTVCSFIFTLYFFTGTWPVLADHWPHHRCGGTRGSRSQPSESICYSPRWRRSPLIIVVTSADRGQVPSSDFLGGGRMSWRGEWVAAARPCVLSLLFDVCCPRVHV